MTRDRHYSYREAAEMLGTDRHTIAGLIRAWKISPRKHPTNGNAAGLREREIEMLREVLRAPFRVGA